MMTTIKYKLSPILGMPVLGLLLAGMAINAQTTEPATIDVIVRFKPQTNQRSQQRLASHGARHKADLKLIDAAVYQVTPQELEALQNDPNVDMVEPDRELSGTLFSGMPDFGWLTAFKSASLPISSPSTQVQG